MNGSFASSIKYQAAALCNITRTLQNIDTRDLLFFFQECYADIYRRVCRIDPGFYAQRSRLDSLGTGDQMDRVSASDSFLLPPHVMEVTAVYEAQTEFDDPRHRYVKATERTRGFRGQYVLEGRRIYVGERQGNLPVWVEYVPHPPLITWPVRNRDPEILSSAPTQPGGRTVGYMEIGDGLVFRDIRDGSTIDMRPFYETDDYEYRSHLVTEPYLVVNYRNRFRNKWRIRIFSSLTRAAPVNANTWNAFDWTGHETNCEALYAVHNDATLGDMVVRDHDDGGRIKRLGFFPDTMVAYPSVIVSDLLTYRLADRIAKLSMMDKPLVVDGLLEARDRFEEYTRVNRAGFGRIQSSRTYSPWL